MAVRVELLADRLDPADPVAGENLFELAPSRLDPGEDLDRVRRLLDELEEAQEIARLLEGARDAPGCRIFIGSENRMFALSGSSVIAAPYRGSQGQVVGVVGVIGPTRLNYARVVPLVDFTAKALTRLMA